MQLRWVGLQHFFWMATPPHMTQVFISELVEFDVLIQNENISVIFHTPEKRGLPILQLLGHAQ